MNRTLLELIKTKLSLIESCKQESFHTMMIYSESLPSLLVQCVGYIENKIDTKRNSRGWDFNCANLNCLLDNGINKCDQKIDKYSTRNCQFLIKTWGSVFNNHCSIFDEYKAMKVFTNVSNQKEFDITVNYLLSRKELFLFMEQKIKELKEYRNEFAHGKINSRRLSVISKQDFYVYFGVLLLVDRCIDSVILHKE